MHERSTVFPGKHHAEDHVDRHRDERNEDRERNDMNHFGVNEILKNRSNPLLKRLNKDEGKRHGQKETGREDAQTNERPLRGRLTICL